MMTNKKLLLSLVLTLIALCSIFAYGSIESTVYFIPKNTANNSNVMIDLSSSKSQSTSEVGVDINNTSTNNLSVFRIKSAIYSGSDSYHNYSQKNNSLHVTITSNDNWQFVHEQNPTSRIPFNLKTIHVKQVTSGDTYVLDTNGVKVVTAKTEDGSTYYIDIPAEKCTRTISGGTDHVEYINDYEVSVELPEGFSYSSMEPGYYSTTITVQIPSFYKYKLEDDGWFIPVYHLYYDKTIPMDIETIVIRGYIGEAPGTEGADASFAIYSASDTYSMELNDDTKQYDVAKVVFGKANLVTSQTSNAENKYKIYLSPASLYTVTGDYDYTFYKMNSDYQTRTNDNTIYYKLYSKNNLATNATSTALTYTANHYYTLTPTFSRTTTKLDGSGNASQWLERWELDTEIYLQVIKGTLDNNASDYLNKKQQGLYYSYIYFTLETN